MHVVSHNIQHLGIIFAKATFYYVTVGDITFPGGARSAHEWFPIASLQVTSYCSLVGLKVVKEKRHCCTFSLQSENQKNKDVFMNVFCVT